MHVIKDTTQTYEKLNFNVFFLFFNVFRLKLKKIKYFWFIKTLYVSLEFSNTGISIMTSWFIWL